MTEGTLGEVLVLLAATLLGERVSRTRWAAIFIVLSGAVAIKLA